MEKREKESNLPYTFGDIAAARFAVYGILDERFRTPQPETGEPLSRLDAVRFLWKAFAEKAVAEKAGDVVLYDNAYDKRVIRRDDAGIPFTDVPEEYEAPVLWAYRNGAFIMSARRRSSPCCSTSWATGANSRTPTR